MEVLRLLISPKQNFQVSGTEKSLSSDYLEAENLPIQTALQMAEPFLKKPKQQFITTQNCSVFESEGKLLPIGQDLKNPNSRAMLDRDLLKKFSDSTGFPDALCWLMKDSTLPPIVKFDDVNLGLAMGAT